MKLDAVRKVELKENLVVVSDISKSVPEGDDRRNGKNVTGLLK